MRGKRVRLGFCLLAASCVLSSCDDEKKGWPSYERGRSRLPQGGRRAIATEAVRPSEYQRGRVLDPLLEPRMQAVSRHPKSFSARATMARTTQPLTDALRRSNTVLRSYIESTAMPLARTTISIDKATLDRFYRAYPAGKRSQVIQQLIERDLEAKNDHLGRMARIVETDPAFQTVRDDSALWEAATKTDGLIDE